MAKCGCRYRDVKCNDLPDFVGHRSMLNPLINSLMKKQLFLMVVAALAMASCSKDESTGINNGNAIDFRVAMQTRAS